jgi:dimethylsulfoniopropionate demethylase
MASVFGEGIRALGFFRFGMFDFRGTRQVIARTGYSRPGGFEVFLRDGALGAELWDTLWKAGERMDIAPGCPNVPDRIEAGLLSYGNEMTRANNPLECGMGKFCKTDGEIEHVGRDALARIARAGVERQIRGIVFDGGRCPPCGKPWPVVAGGPDGPQIGQVTSAGWSPRLHRNVGLSMVAREFWNPGQPVTVFSVDGAARAGVVSSLPFA